uniref:TadG family pilus assembly protein n=1 Tax=Tardiphaga sp. TaxID=1926292 RepID=UPI0037D9DFBF
MASLMNLLRRFAADQRGNIAFMSVGGMTLAICCAALGVDVGTIAADRRKTQSAADIAAIVAASNLTNATNAARSAVTNNNYPATALTSVELGTYTADSSIPVQSRFVTPAVGTANAARVTVQTSTPLYFSKFFTGSNAFTIKTQAIAANTQIGSFAIGSRLASLNGGLLNSVLGSLLGTTLSLSVMDYQALLNARIDAFDFLSALSTRIGLTAATYDNVLNANVKVGDILAAALSTQQATNGGSTATTALSTISQAATSSTAKLTPLSLIDAGPYADLKVGTKPKTGVSLSLFDLLQATAGIANGTNQVNTGVNINLPGIASVQLIVQIGERPQGSSWVAVGNKGVSVHTAQTRVLLQVKLIGTGAASVVNLPVYVEVGSGTATL